MSPPRGAIVSLQPGAQHLMWNINIYFNVEKNIYKEPTSTRLGLFFFSCNVALQD